MANQVSQAFDTQLSNPVQPGDQEASVSYSTVELFDDGARSMLARPAHEHSVQFYDDEADLVRSVARFLNEGIEAGDAVVVVATQGHGASIQRGLEASGCDVAAAIGSGQLVVADARHMLAEFMRDGEPDPSLFDRSIGSLVASKTRGGAVRLRAYGEMVDVLWQAGERQAALHLEELWNELQNRHAFKLFCAYAMASFYKEPLALQEVCATHTHRIDRTPALARAGEGSNGFNGTAGSSHYEVMLAKEVVRREEIEQGLRESLRELRHKVVDNARLYQENEQARSRAEQLYRFADVVVTAERVEQVFDAALHAIGLGLGTERAAILVFDEAGVMRFKAWRGLSEGYRAAVEGHSPWSRDTGAPKPVLVSDVQTDEALSSYRSLFASENIGSLAFIPLLSRGKLLGKFMVYYPTAHDYSSHEVQLSSAIANHLGSVIERFATISKLEETIHYNELFAGILAHDLRNPLGAMMTAAQLILMFDAEGSSGDVAKPVGHLMRSGQRMSAMIDQLLDVSQARAGGGIQVQPCAANLADLCRQTVTEIQLANPKWKIRLEVSGDPLGCWDAGRLMQVLSNLVANAGQHGSVEGGIQISLDGGRQDFVRVEVHNQGTISPSLLPSLFDPFRGTRHRRDQARGLGLGLFVVKEIVRAHGGTVNVASDDSGTTFTVQLPRQARASLPVR